MSQSGPVIVGIHQMYHPFGKVGCQPITVEFIEAMLGERQFICAADPMLNTKSSKVGELGEIHPKSATRFVEEGSLLNFGSFKGFRAQPRSRVKKTFLCKELETIGITLEFGKPIMKDWRPYHHNLKGITSYKRDMPEDVLRACYKNLLSKWLTVDKKFLAQLGIYDWDTVTNGVAGLRFVDRMNMSSSAGFPFKTTKKKFIEPLRTLSEFEMDLDGPVKFTEEILKRAERRESAYLENRLSHPVFTASLKDEALKMSKVEEGRTRIFFGGPVDFIMVMRKYMLSFVRILQLNKFIFEQAPGTESQTIEWEWIALYLKNKGGPNRLVFGDFQAFDVTMTSLIIIYAFELIAEFHDRSGCPSEQSRVIRAIGRDIAFCYIDYNGDLLQVFGINPSGQALTVIINGIVNCFYMRYAYIVQHPNYNGSNADDLIDYFDEHVALMTYGDDNGMGISPNCNWMTHITIADALKPHGIVYTMADKTAEMVDYITIEEATFLKRHFRFDHEIGRYMSPLLEKSIYKSLMIQVESPHVSQEE